MARRLLLSPAASGAFVLTAPRSCNGMLQSPPSLRRRRNPDDKARQTHRSTGHIGPRVALRRATRFGAEHGQLQQPADWRRRAPRNDGRHVERQVTNTVTVTLGKYARLSINATTAPLVVPTALQFGTAAGVDSPGPTVTVSCDTCLGGDGVNRCGVDRPGARCETHLGHQGEDRRREVHRVPVHRGVRGGCCQRRHRSPTTRTTTSDGHAGDVLARHQLHVFLSVIE